MRGDLDSILAEKGGNSHVCKASYMLGGRYLGRYRTVDDKEHNEIIAMYAGEGLSVEAIGTRRDSPRESLTYTSKNTTAACNVQGSAPPADGWKARMRAHWQ